MFAPSISTYILNAPTNSVDSFGKCWSQFFRIMDEINQKPSGSIVTIDFSHSKFVMPFFLLPLKLYSMQRTDIDIKFTSTSTVGHSNNCINYLHHINYFEGLKPESIDSGYDELLNQFNEKTYIPFIDFPAEKKEGCTDIRNKFLSGINQLITTQLKLKGNYRTAIMYLIDEAVNNIVDHSCEERGFVFAQFFKKSGYVDICLGDNGVTLLNSFNASGKFNLKSDKEAVIKAINGFSTKNRPECEDRGFGISTSLKMLTEGLGGQYLLLSGSSLFHQNSEKSILADLPEGLIFNGTTVAFRIPLEIKKDFIVSNYYE